MTFSPLPTNIDATYDDDPLHPSKKIHQQYHDRLHARFNERDTLNDALYWGVYGPAMTVADSSPHQVVGFHDDFIDDGYYPDLMNGGASLAWDAGGQQVQILVDGLYKIALSAVATSESGHPFSFYLWANITPDRADYMEERNFRPAASSAQELLDIADTVWLPAGSAIQTWVRVQGPTVYPFTVDYVDILVKRVG